MSALGASEEGQRRLLSTISAPRVIAKLRSDLANRDDAIKWVPSAGGLLRALRLRSGLTQVELAQRIGVAQSTLARWERGDRWPSATELHEICFAVGATGPEVATLTCNPSSLSPVLPTEPLTFDQATHWGRLVIWNAIEGTQPDLTELHFWQLLAGVWQRHHEWGPEGSDLLADILARLAQWYLGNDPGSGGLQKGGRVSEAATFARRALKIESGGQATLTATIVLAQTQALTHPTTNPASSLKLLAPWSNLKVAAEGDWGHDRFPPDYSAWVKRELAVYAELGGEPEAAVRISLEAQDIAKRSMRTVEARFRANDHAEMMLRLGRPQEALEVLYPTPSIAPAVLAWEFQLQAEALLGLGDTDAAIPLAANVSRLASTYRFPSLARRATNLQARIEDLER